MNATFRGLLIALSIASLTLPLFGAAPLTIMARTGSGGITGIDPNIAINREGIIAFTGRDATGSRVFVVSSPNQVTGIVTASNRTHSGVGITSGMNPAVIARELVSGSSPITLIRKTPIAGGGSLVLGSSSSAPIDWDSVSGSVDISSGGIAVASALVNGSTLTRLFFGISRPMTPTPAAYSGNILLRPQISDSGEAVIRDKDGHIITMNVSGVVRIPADTSNGFASDTGNKPGISTDGTVIAFSGNRNGTGSAIYALVTPAGYPASLVAVAGGPVVESSGDVFTNFTSDQRVGVRARHNPIAGGGTEDIFTVVFQGAKNGVAGIHTRNIIVINGVVQSLGPAIEVVKVGDSLAGATVTGFTLYRPINDDAVIACTVNLSDGSVAIVTTRLLFITLRDVTDTTGVEPVIEPSILRVSVTSPPSIATLPALQKRRKKLRINIKGPASTALKLFIAADTTSNGGHDHLLPNANRPHGWLATTDVPTFPLNFGQVGFESGGTTKYSSYDDTNSVTVATDTLGDAHVYYTAPEICGAEKISVATIDPVPTARSVTSVTVDIKADLTVPFVELQGSSDIERTGILPAHLSSHWGIAALKTAIENMAQNYAVERQRGTVPNFPLPVNDMSLIHGGFFDIDGDWNVEKKKGHKGHRLGIEVDIGGPMTGSGHGLIPGANAAFETLWMEQGWLKPVPEGDHFHFVLNGDGMVAIAFLAPATTIWQDEPNRVVIVHVPFENAGSLAGNAVTIDNLQTRPAGAATIQTPVPVPAGVAPIRSTGSLPLGFNVQAIVAPGVKGFTLSGGGSATSGALPPFPVPSKFRGRKFSCFVRVPSSTSPSSILAIKRQALGGGWSVTLSNSSQPASLGATVVYSGTIQNNTGADFFLTSADLRFTMSAPDASYEFELAPEFLDTGGVIPPAGYTGPLFTIHWIAEPPLSARGSGSLAITPDVTSGLPAQNAAFSSYYNPQTLEIVRVGGQLVLSWALEASNMVLESSDVLDGENQWTAVDAPVAQMNGRNTVTLDITEETKFFRLNSYY